MDTGKNGAERSASCHCLDAPSQDLVTLEELGMDSRFAEVTRLACPLCGRQWLRYHYENEAFTSSGRWYLGCLEAGQASRLTADNALAVLSDLSWYFYGGSYFRGQSGKASGAIY